MQRDILLFKYNAAMKSLHLQYALLRPAWQVFPEGRGEGRQSAKVANRGIQGHAKPAPNCVASGTLLCHYCII